MRIPNPLQAPGSGRNTRFARTGENPKQQRRHARTWTAFFGFWTATVLLAGVSALFPACNPLDTTDPFVVVLEPEYRVPLGGTYVEQGALATDKQDGVLDTSAIFIDASAVRTDSVGEYPVRYYASDAAGNEDSATRDFGVFVRPIHYAGTWMVADTCDSVASSYSVTFGSIPGDTNTVTIANFRNRGSSFVVELNTRGVLGRVIELSDTVNEYIYSGQQTLLSYATLDLGFAFDLVFDESDTLENFSACTARFTKP